MISRLFPDDVRPIRCDEVLGIVRERVREVVAGNVNCVGSGIVKLEPIVVIVIRGIGQRVGVRRHPFVDENDQRRGAAIVWRSRRNVNEFQAIEWLPVRKGAVGAVGVNPAVIHVVEHLRFAIVETRQRQ